MKKLAITLLILAIGILTINLLGNESNISILEGTGVLTETGQGIYGPYSGNSNEAKEDEPSEEVKQIFEETIEDAVARDCREGEFKGADKAIIDECKILLEMHDTCSKEITGSESQKMCYADMRNAVYNIMMFMQSGFTY